LIPERVVPNRWVQKELKAPELDIWIEAIKHFRPGYQTAARRWKRTIENALNGLRPSRQVKAIEGITSADLRGCDDTTTLFDDDEESEDENLLPSSQATQRYEKRDAVMSFVEDMGLEGIDSGTDFTQQQQMVWDNWSQQQDPTFGVPCLSQETIYPMLWSDDMGFDRENEENCM